MNIEASRNYYIVISALPFQVLVLLTEIKSAQWVEGSIPFPQKLVSFNAKNNDGL
jgi:hypothetical protein